MEKGCLRHSRSGLRDMHMALVGAGQGPRQVERGSALPDCEHKPQTGETRRVWEGNP